MTSIPSRSSRVGPAPAGSLVQSAAVADRRKRKRVAAHERVIVTGMVAFGIAVSVLGSMRVAGDVREARARETMAGTFSRVHERQHEFHRANARFATLPELSAEGLRLPGRHQVRRSTADGSHWFLSLRDRNTGLICDRTGELTDETGRDREPVCRPGENRRAVASINAGAASGTGLTAQRVVMLAGGLGGQ